METICFVSMFRLTDLQLRGSCRLLYPFSALDGRRSPLLVGWKPTNRAVGYVNLAGTGMLWMYMHLSENQVPDFKSATPLTNGVDVPA